MQISADYDISDINVLIIDDNRYTLSMLREMLRWLNVRNVNFAKNGKEALSIKVETDLVFCDLQMAPVSGMEFTNLVRANKTAYPKSTPIIMLTGHTERERVIQARDMGSSLYLAKPISVRRLYQAITQIIDSSQKFIETENYIGPDRRRKNIPLENLEDVLEDRRGDVVEEGTGNIDASLSQEELDTLLKDSN